MLLQHFLNEDGLPRPQLSRRGVLAGATTLGAAAVTGGIQPVAAKQAKSQKQAAGIYRRRVGSFEITALLDGYIDVAHEFWKGIERPALERAATQSFLPADGKIRIGVTSYHINTGSRSILIDSGSADLFGPTAGRFAESLAAAEIEPQAIDVIALTHMHPDHIGALVTPQGQAVFPNATIFVCGADHSFWTSSSSQGAAPDFAKPWFDSARRVANAYRGRLELFSGAPEIVPGVTAVPLVGHTPGHTGYRIASDKDQLLLWGDMCGVASVQFAHPDAGLVFDVDGDTGRATRRRTLDMAASDRLLVAAAHLPFPSFGHVARAGSAYAWVPEEWQFSL